MHIIKGHGDDVALTMVHEHSKHWKVAVLLIQDAVLDSEVLDPAIDVFASSSDVEARGISINANLLDYGEIVDIIFKAEKVICW